MDTTASTAFIIFSPDFSYFSKGCAFLRAPRGSGGRGVEGGSSAGTLYTCGSALFPGGGGVAGWQGEGVGVGRGGLLNHGPVGRRDVSPPGDPNLGSSPPRLLTREPRLEQSDNF